MLTDREPHLPEIIEEVLGLPVYELLQADKSAYLLPVFNQLHVHHTQQCASYFNAFSSHGSQFKTISELPFVAVRLFKLLNLKSVSEDKVTKCLLSSGTTGSTPSKVYLDAVTSRWQSKALVKIMQQFLGKQRLPMLIIDSPPQTSDGSLNARAAGIQGLGLFGRHHTYALNSDMSINWKAIEQFSAKFANVPTLIFGFTFMVWQHFILELQRTGKQVNLPQGHLFHSGGWKKLAAQEVDNTTFKQVVKRTVGISQVTNFYGMAEQVGSVFMECERGFLHAPVTADIIIRNPYNFKVCARGERGLVQVLSVLPYSYPGFSILTEDLGTLRGTDDCQCGRKGNYFTLHGRLPKVEIRGCSDTSQSPLS
ncbi:acyl-protein synthetase [Alteromonas sp. ASW11-19]|uniref:Acyl-protein synthetase n=1 Tax=Alteromonas salexigens TaxID=2982530 RepID=A0ABT2VNW0_9ALTE|nr:acyl-protein synthetase [Alteromonas salexigens]MCU7554995.1 acyl-protein synthetase [Alteromonas salexigens]